METKQYKWMTVALVLMTGLLISFLGLVETGRIPLGSYADYLADAQMDELDLLEYYTEEDEEVEITDQIIRIELAEGLTEEDIQLTNNYRTQSLLVELEGSSEDYLYQHPLVGGSSHIYDLTYEDTAEGMEFEVTFDSVYEFQTYQEDGYFYIELIHPHDVYDEVVVIDPGHGGESSPGTVRQGVTEAPITLEIALDLQELLEEEGIGVYITRVEDVDTSLSSRVSLANSVNADMFLSIHVNAVSSNKMDESTYGVEVMYDESDVSGQSKRLAEICAENVASSLNTRNRGVIEGDSIYIIRESQVPVALTEVGFLSNKKELAALQTSEYLMKAAEGLRDAVLEAMDEGF